jgi:hypothetical protein
MFRHNYLSVNGIVSFPSFTWLYNYKEEYKQGEMWHSAQRAKYVCSSLAVARQRVHDSHPRKPTMRNFLYLGNGSVTMDISTATIDRGINKYPGNAGESASYYYKQTLASYCTWNKLTRKTLQQKPPAVFTYSICSCWTILTNPALCRYISFKPRVLNFVKIHQVVFAFTML